MQRNTLRHALLLTAATLLLPAALSVHAMDNNRTQTCHALMTTDECTRYLSALRTLPEGDERDRYLSAHSTLIKDRESACRCQPVGMAREVIFRRNQQPMLQI